MGQFTVNSFMEHKGRKKISMLTAYDYSMAKMFDEAGVDTILVGDSLGMVVLGYDTTLKVTMEDMIHHTSAVSRGVKNALVIGDMPFLSYHISVEEAIRNAGRLVQEGGAHAVKLEGGEDVLPQIIGILRAQIPVIGHLGLTPQSINKFGGFKVQGKGEKEAKKIMKDALLLEEAGVSAIVLEAIPDRLAALITSKLSIPTIGIGASAACDGQVLVSHDMLGMFSDFTPKFVKKFSDLKPLIMEGVRSYIEEVNDASFPSKEHTFSIEEDIINKLY